jgi:hypothetical protein
MKAILEKYLSFYKLYLGVLYPVLIVVLAFKLLNDSIPTSELFSLKLDKNWKTVGETSEDFS